MDTAADNSAALAIRDSACDDLIAKLEEEAAASDANTAEIAPFVRELFARYFDASQKKNEPAEVASAKISKMVGKQARKKFAISSEPVPTADRASEPETVFTGQVAGKTSGIERKILNILTAVSAHFGEPITILSGQRSKPQQVQALYTNWQSHLRRGKDNAYLAKNEKLREQLDILKQEKNKEKFVALLNKSADFSALSRHIDGNEVDLAANTDPDIVAALATCLNHSAGRNSEGARCHHFDNSKAVWPITESTRAKWKTP